MKTQCTSSWGHKYQGCYDTTEYMPPINGKFSAGVEALKVMKHYDSTYVKHVCVRCGDTVKRDE